MHSLNEELKRLNSELYRATYIDKDQQKKEQIWNCIKENKKLLEQASKVVKDKFGERDTFLATSIVECMLVDYANVDKEVYQALVNKIYTNRELARIVLDGFSNGGYSFLLYTLFNRDINLTEEQVAFAIEEAMNKMGTTSNNKQRITYEQELEKNNITNALTVIDPEIGPIGAKTASIRVADILGSMSTSQAHGIGEFDIRYYILKNHNFTDKMEKLAFDFYASDETYAETVDCWEWNIVNSCFGEDSEPKISIDEILFIEESEVFARLPFEEAREVIDEINFIKRIRTIRPIHWKMDESGFSKKLV